jgi:hypothetical protein
MSDDQIEQITADYHKSGFSYQPYVSNPEWGLTICSHEFVRSQVAQHDSLQFVSFRQVGWGPQDVFAYTKS